MAPNTSKHLKQEMAQKLEIELQNIKYALDESAIVAITDVQGIIIYVNDKFCQISKYTPEELIGKTHRIIKSDHHSQKFFEGMWKTIGNGSIWKGDVKNRAKDGSHYWVDTTIVPLLNERKKPHQYAVIRHEITERKQMEKEIRRLNEQLEHRVSQRTEELKKANTELKEALEKVKESEVLRDTFISALTHDLRTPLIAQQRAFDILQSQKELLPDKLSGLVERLVHSNEDLLSMVNKLLEINQYEAGKVRLNREPVNLCELAAECLQELSLIAETKDIELVNELSLAIPTISGDRQQLKRVFINLIGNALDNIPTNSRIEIRESNENGVIEVEVRDNGPGIPPEIQEHLFDRYFVVQRTRKKIGSGLGLYICKMILGLHGGNIRVKSDVGKGTSFFITLPRKQGSESIHE